MSWSRLSRICVAPRRKSPRAALLGVALPALGAAAACGGKDPYAPIAYLPTVSTRFIVYTMRSATPPQTWALDLRTPAPVQPGVYLSATSGVLVPNFDVAFNVDSTGRLILLPPKLVTASQIVPQVGFQTSTTPFDSLRAAPGGTYQADSTFRVTVGQTIVVQSQGVACRVASPFYARLVIDSFDPTTGAISLRALIDPNCGFKSFASGVPTS